MPARLAPPHTPGLPYRLTISVSLEFKVVRPGEAANPAA